MCKTNEDLFVILIGNKARQGKDALALSFKKQFPNSEILHFADAVKEEVMNKKRKYPLIYKQDDHFHLLDRELGTPIYQPFYYLEFPMLNDIFNNRGITEYWGMDGNGHDEHKDGLMLQFWGTDFRRKYTRETYWVDIICDKILDLKKDGGIKYVMLPDTRFLNEYKLIYRLQDSEFVTRYVSVERYYEDGTRFLADDRDNLHISETELDGVHADYTFTNINGQLDAIDKYASYLQSSLVRSH